MKHRTKKDGETVVPANEFLKKRPSSGTIAGEAFDRELHKLRKNAAEGDLKAKERLRKLHGHL